jgi:hypothetical protein
MSSDDARPECPRPRCVAAPSRPPRSGLALAICDHERVAGALRSAGLQLRAVPRLMRRGRGPLRARLGPLDERIVFVLGSPRSGTTFLASSIGSLPGFVDLGELTPHKASIPELAGLPPEEAAPRIRRLLDVTRRLGLVAGLRAVEQTPENVFVAEALRLAFPAARFVHIVRDGRDVVCSLLDRGWLSAGRGGGDDAGLPYGTAPRFWVELERAAEFPRASDARRAAWAWRRYVGTARGIEGALEVRYELLVEKPAEVAGEIARFLDAPAEPLTGTLGAARTASVGRYRRELDPDRLKEVEEECGELLRELGYLQNV